jgi:hypothetical protein
LTHISRYGAIPDISDIRDFGYHLSVVATRAAANGGLPARIDNRDYCPPIEDQGTIPACVGYAAAGIAGMQYWRVYGERQRFSGLGFYRIAQEYDHIPGISYAGTTPRGLLEAWRRIGSPLYDTWPDGANDWAVTGDAVRKTASKYRLPRYERLTGIDETRHAIFQQGAVLMVIRTHDRWDAPGSSVIRRQPGDAYGEYHAVVAVGYDNDERFFIIRNSWGPIWGMLGYGAVSFGDFEDITDIWLPLIPLSWATRTWRSIIASLFS